jgi:hypothetical protein
MISIEPPHLKAKINNDTIRYYVEEDYRFINDNRGYVICCLGRIIQDEYELKKSPKQVKQFIGKVKLNEFLSKFHVGEKKLINGKEHVLNAIDIHIHESEFEKRVNTSKFVGELYFNVIGDKNDYRYI